MLPVYYNFIKVICNRPPVDDYTLERYYNYCPHPYGRTVYCQFYTSLTHSSVTIMLWTITDNTTIGNALPGRQGLLSATMPACSLTLCPQKNTSQHNELYIKCVATAMFFM